MMRKLGIEPSVVVKVRIAGEWWQMLVELADKQNPPRELIRGAIRRFLQQNGKLNA